MNTMAATGILELSLTVGGTVLKMTEIWHENQVVTRPSGKQFSVVTFSIVVKHLVTRLDFSGYLCCYW